MERDASHSRRPAVAVLAGLAMLGWLMVTIISPAPPAGAWGMPETPPIPSVSAGGYMSCGIRTDGTAACWGEDGTPSNDLAQTHPGGAATPPAGQFLEVNSGYSTACGVKTDHTLACWGNGRFEKTIFVPGGQFQHVAPGLGYVCAIRTDGTIVCWGGDIPTTDPDQKVRRDVPSGQFKQVTVGNRHACALRDDGSNAIVCWGHSTATGSNNPITGLPAGSYIAVNAASNASCALRTNGTPVCWGGGGAALNTGYPTEGGNPMTFTHIATGTFHACGLRADKSVVCWGRNSEGQVSPVPAGTYTQVSAGNFHTCGMRVGETKAVCWGNNMSGRVQPNMTSTAPHQGYADVPYSANFTMNRSPIAGAGDQAGISPAPTFRLAGGDLPPGLTLSPAGVLAGTPTTAGSYPITLAASNGLSPEDCAVPVTLAAVGDSQTMPCVPGDTTSVATATRAFTVNIGTDVPAAGTITGRATSSADSSPIAGATVSLAYADTTPVAQTTTDANGYYTFAGPLPESYKVTAGTAAFTAQTKPATVTSGATTTVDFSLVPRLTRPQIEGVWSNHWQTVSDGVFVQWSEEFDVLTQTGTGYSVHTQSDCSDPAVAQGFRSNWLAENPNWLGTRMPSRTRDIEMTGYENVTPGATYYLKVAAGTELGKTTLQTNNLICAQYTAQLRPSDRSTISGQVKNSGGTGIPGVTVTVKRPQCPPAPQTCAFVYREPGTVIGTATTDANGNYSVQNLPPSSYPIGGYSWSYSVSASAPPTYRAATGTATTTFNAGTATVAPSTSSATVNLTLPTNAAPQIGADPYSVDEDTPLSVGAPGVLGNDTDPEGDTPLTAALVTSPTHGSLTFNSDGSFLYTPNTNYNGADSFTYTATDSLGATSGTATATITVDPVNDGPTAVNDSYSATKNVPLTVAAPGVLGNDSDVEDATLTASVVTGPANGTLTLNGNGSFTYTPKGGFAGADAFTYRATDSGGASATATVAITVVPAPSASADLSVTIADSPDPVARNGTVTYTVTVANVGPNPATGVTLTPTLKGGSFGTLTPSQGTCGSAKGGVSCSLGTIAAGGSATITITAKAPNKAGTMSLTAKASSGTPDPVSANNSKAESTTVS